MTIGSLAGTNWTVVVNLTNSYSETLGTFAFDDNNQGSLHGPEGQKIPLVWTPNGADLTVVFSRAEQKITVKATIDGGSAAGTMSTLWNYLVDTYPLTMTKNA